MVEANNSKKIAVGFAISACAVCCAPLVIPPLLALVAASNVGLTVFGQVGRGVLVLISMGGYIYMRRSNTMRMQKACGCKSCHSVKQGESQ